MRLSVVLAALLLLTGCEPRLAIDADFDRYLSRIANVQQRDALSPPAMAAQSLPEKRKLLIAIDPVTISLLDSYELRQCGLFELIAERNSILGKVQDEFREWDYQVALLNGIQGCLTSPQQPILESTVARYTKTSNSRSWLHVGIICFTPVIPCVLNSVVRSGTMNNGATVSCC